MKRPFGLRFDLPFRRAIEAAVRRGVVLPDEFYGELDGNARQLAFTVSAIESVDQIRDILDSLNVALSEGRSFEEWARVAAADDMMGRLTPGRRELVFRNAMQTAYGVGRTIEQRENADSRPFLMWDAINDSRTRENHAAMDGYVAPIDDPVWKTWSPPAGHNCRCTRIALTEGQARARGYPMPPRNVRPDPGWEHESADGDETLEGVRDVLRKRLGTALPRPIREAIAAILGR